LAITEHSRRKLISAGQKNLHRRLRCRGTFLGGHGDGDLYEMTTTAINVFASYFTSED
jgi:hypothetical protein